VAYDDNGNLTTRSSATLTYDDENQLTRAMAASSFRVDFTYDGRGRLRVKAEYTPGFGTNWTLSAETRYVYHGRLVVQERAASNTPTASYTRGADLSGTMEGAGGIGGLLARSHGYSGGTGAWSTHHAYHADGGGNITALVASNQTLSATYKYDPYGRSVSTSGSMAAANTQRFSSKEIVASTGFYYYGYRFYDPEHQRWLNRDPIGEDGGANLFGFVRNQPHNLIDPDGRHWVSPGAPPPSIYPLPPPIYPLPPTVPPIPNHPSPIWTPPGAPPPGQCSVWPSNPCKYISSRSIDIKNCSKSDCKACCAAIAAGGAVYFNAAKLHVKAACLVALSTVTYICVKSCDSCPNP